MARVRATVYKNSILASIVSIYGSLCVFAGVSLITQSILACILVIVYGAFHCWLGAYISERANYKAWKKEIEKKVDIERIKKEIYFAVKVYNTNPCNMVLKYIRNLNPEAAEYIKQRIAEKEQQEKEQEKKR